MRHPPAPSEWVIRRLVAVWAPLASGRTQPARWSYRPLGEVVASTSGAPFPCARKVARYDVPQDFQPTAVESKRFGLRYALSCVI
jgi:hypothetical protein